MTNISIRVTKVLALALLLLQNVRCQSGIGERSLSTSIVGMEYLLQAERDLLSAMESYANKLENKLNIIRSAILEMQTENLKSQINPEEYLSNPINSYALIRRLHEDWVKWELFLRSSVGEDKINSIQDVRAFMPTSVDLMEASEAIYRLNVIYDIKPIDMAVGLISGKQYDARFSAIDCFSIADLMFQNDAYYFSEAWLYTSLQLYQDSDTNAVLEFDIIKIFDLHTKLCLKQDRLTEALSIIDFALNLSPHNDELLRKKSGIEFQIRNPTKTVSGTTKQVPVNEENYHIGQINWMKNGCRQYDYKSKLHCLYNKTTTAFLQLAPLKMEILNLDPYVILYHDVISDAEIAALKKEAGKNLRRAVIGNSVNFTVNKGRTVKGYWFHNQTTMVKRVNKKITDMSGFDLRDSDSLEMLNYGMGGHYGLHYDFFNSTDVAEEPVARDRLIRGDRIATVLFYLSDVEQGGATVFPNIEIGVLPKKGNALMWYNLNSKGEIDTGVLHGACPVIVGSKWVLTKWIRSNNQMFRRRCFA